MSNFRRTPGRRSLLAAAPAVLLASAARAQDFPTRPIRFIVGFAPGGSADVMARILGQSLADKSASR